MASTALAHELINQKRQLELLRTNEQTQQSSDRIPTLSLENDSAESVKKCLLSLQNRPEWLVHQFVKFHLARIRLTLGSEECESVKAAELETQWITELDPQCVEAWAQLGHLRYLVGDYAGSRAFYEHCLALKTWPPNDPHLLRLRLGQTYLRMEEVNSFILYWLSFVITQQRLLVVL